MRRTISAAVFVLLATAGDAQTPARPTVDQVLEKYIAAVGGRAALEKVTSATAKGTLEIAAMGITGTVTLSQKAPNKSLQVSDLSGIGVQREGFDGTVSWTEDAQTGVREKAGQELVESRRAATFPRELRLKEMYSTMKIAGQEKVGANEAIVIIATPSNGSDVQMFFDVQTGLLVRTIALRDTAAGPIQVDSTFEDFRAVDGIKRAHVIRQSNPQFTAVIRLSEIKHNVPMDDAIFKKPGT